MTNVVVVIATQSLEVDVSVEPGKFRYELIPASGSPVTQDSDELTATFNDVAPGSYTATALRLDSAGNSIGSAISAPVVVPAAEPAPAPAPAPATATAPDVPAAPAVHNVDVPSSITVTLS